MLSEKIQQALNNQINEELSSAYVYLAMAALADGKGLPGMANWFKMQYQEELVHADRFFHYVLERNGEVELEAIAKPEVDPEATALQLFESALAYEVHISQCIYKIKDLAREESDHPTDVFLEWFVREQVEEESSVQLIIDKLKLVDGDRNGLFMIDQELGSRKVEGPEA